MYQFTTTNIINSNLDSNGTTNKYVGDADKFNVTRVGTFLAAGITSVSKRAYYSEVLEIAQVTIPTIAVGLVARLEVDIRLSQQTDSEYANSYLYFKKPVTVEILSLGTDTLDAAALALQINKLRDRYGFAYVTATVDGANVIIAATNSNQRIFDLKISKESTEPYANTIIEPLYIDVTAGTFVINIVGRVGFGDDNWMSRRIILPTAENVRYFGISKDERPIIGGNYTEFVLNYKVTKDHTVGMAQAADISMTTHVFYVLSTLVAAFEDQLDNTAVVTEVFGGGVIVISGDFALTNSDTTTLLANGAVGTEVWTVVSGTSVTVDAPGAGAITADVAITGDTVIQVVDSEGTVGTVTVTVA